MTGPLIFLSPPSELYLTNEEAYGVRRRLDDLVTEDVARGSYAKGQSNDEINVWLLLTARASLEDIIFAEAVAAKK